MRSNSITSFAEKIIVHFFGSIRKKILLGFIFTYFLTVFVFGIVLFSQINKSSFEQYRLNASSISAQIISTHLVPLKITAGTVLDDLIIDYNKIIDIKALAIYDSNNKLISSASRKMIHGEDQNVYFGTEYTENRKMESIPEYAWFYLVQNYTSHKNENYKFVMLISNYSYVDGLNRLKTWGSVALLVSAIIIIPLSYLLGKSSVKSIKELSDNLDNVTVGSAHNSLLSNRYLEVEVHNLADKINKNISDLNDFIKGYKTSGSIIKEFSNNLSENVSVFSAAIIQQGSATSQTSSAFEELGVSIKTISESAESIVSVAEKTKSFSEEGVEAADVTVNTIMKIQDNNKIGRDKLIELGNKSYRISNILKVMDDLNDQTQLISFNAMIEAVGAGDAGRRFKVVASEIKELSENLEEKSKIIKSILLEISDYIQEVIEENKKNDPVIKSSLASGELLKYKLKAINEYAHLTNDNIRNIYYATEQQDKAVNEVILSMKEITNGSESFMDGSFKIQEVADKLQAISNEIIV